jgi:hypothetical protein
MTEYKSSKLKYLFNIIILFSSKINYVNFVSIFSNLKSLYELLNIKI